MLTALNRKRRRESLDIENLSIVGNNDKSVQSVYRSILQRSTYSQRSFGRTITVPGRSAFRRFKSPNNMAYQFLFPDDEFCTPLACDFSHELYDGHMLAVGDEDGRLSLLRTDKNNDPQNMSYHHSFYCHKQAISDVKWSMDDTMLVTASHDRLVRLVDTETTTTLAEFASHSDVVKSVNWHPTNEHLIVSGSKDGSFRIWDTRFNQLPAADPSDLSRIPVYNPIKSITAAHSDVKSQIKSSKKTGFQPLLIRSVTCALFVNSDETKLLSSGSVDGSIKLWDIRAGKANKVLQTTIFESTTGKRNGITDLKIDSSGTRLFSSCMDNNVYMHYLTDLSKPAKKYSDPNYKVGSFDIKISVSADDKFLLSGSRGNELYMWDIDNPHAEAYAYEGHSKKVASVAWSKRNVDQFASCSDDYKVRIWNLDDGSDIIS